MRRIVRDKIFFILIYIDNNLILTDEAEIKRIEEFFKKEFTWITMNVETSCHIFACKSCLSKEQ
jgi:hypothetical protein